MLGLTIYSQKTKIKVANKIDIASVQLTLERTLIETV